MDNNSVWACRGSLVQNASFHQPCLLEDRLVVVGSGTHRGKILAIAAGSQEAQVCSQHGINPADLVRLQEGELLCPGFIDLHVHAPQYSYTGTATDRPLMEWLEAYAFPRETAHSDADAASREYRKLCSRLIAHGTTTALFFGTIHKAACQRLALCLQEQGLRGYVGKVCMDRQSPDGYTESTADSLSDTKAFLRWVHELNDDKIQAVVTPRFIPTCTPDLLQGLGKLAADWNAPVQSHISESFDEVEYSESLHPGEQGDAALFLKSGLLTNKAVMAHGTCLTDSELGLLAKQGTAIAHCPLSNFFFGDRVLRVRHALDLGVKIGLGTDVAGGYSPSMLSAMRNCVVASRALCMQLYAMPPTADSHETSSTLAAKMSTVSPDSSQQHSLNEDALYIPASEARQKIQKANLLDWRSAFWLATIGGAQALGLEQTCGTLEVGKAFDALRVDTRKSAAFDVFPADSPMDAFQKFINLGDDRNIVAVWVGGKLVHEKASR